MRLYNSILQYFITNIAKYTVICHISDVSAACIYSFYGEIGSTFAFILPQSISEVATGVNKAHSKSSSPFL